MKKGKGLSKRLQRTVDAMSPAYSQKTDPLGSYTGRPAAGDVRPVQDADDL